MRKLESNWNLQFLFSGLRFDINSAEKSGIVAIGISLVSVIKQTKKITSYFVWHLEKNEVAFFLSEIKSIEILNEKNRMNDLLGL